MPTATIITLTDIRLDIRAAMGAANALPMIKPAIALHGALLSIIKKVSDPIIAMKNRVSLTVPNEKRG